MQCSRVWWVATGLAAVLPGQSIEEVREQLRNSLRSSSFSALPATLADVAADGQLSLGTLRPDDSGADWTLFALPWRRDLVLGDELPPLRVEASVGYSLARFRFDDVWGGEQPGLETGLRTRFESFAADVGAGPVLALPAQFRLVPQVHVGAAHIENTAYYAGPGATLTGSLLDGLLFNWDQTNLSYGASGALEYRGWQGGRGGWLPTLRYDVRRSEPVVVDDPALDVSTTEQWATVRLVGTGLVDAAAPDGWLWQLDVGYRRLLGDSAEPLGFEDFVEFGAGLRWPAPFGFAVLDALSLHGAVQVGEDVRGWSFGVVVSF